MKRGAVISPFGRERESGQVRSCNCERSVKVSLAEPTIWNKFWCYFVHVNTVMRLPYDD